MSSQEEIAFTVPSAKLGPFRKVLLVAQSKACCAPANHGDCHGRQDYKYFVIYYNKKH